MARTSKRNRKNPNLTEQPVKVYSAGIYARLSVDSEERKSESIETQIEIAEEFISRQNDIRLYDIYTDLGRTGTNFAREGFERMMRDVRAHEIDCIVVKDLSRFGRNHIETGNYIEKIFPFLGVRFVAVADNFDSIDPVSDETLSVNLKNLVNEMYARDISMKVRSSRQAKWEQESYTGGIPPYGYRAEWMGDKKCLLVEETAAEIVKKIFELFLSGCTLKEIICWLYENKIESPAQYHKTGQIYCAEKEELRQWTQGTIKMILTNPVYMGCLVQKSANGKNDRIRSRQEMDSGNWKVKKHTHEAIIPEDLFFQASEKFQKSSAAHSKKGISETIPVEEDIFGGILFCGECGSKMRRLSKIKKIKESGTEGRARTYYYNCPNSARIDGFKCERKSITLDVLKNIVTEAVRQEMALSALYSKGLAEDSRQKEQKREWNKRLAVMERNLAGITRLGSEQYLKYRMGEIDQECFRQLQEKNQQKAAAFRKQKEAMEENMKAADMEGNEKAAGRKGSVQAAGRKGSVEAADRKESKLTREAVQVLIHRIEIYPDHRVKVIFAFRRKDDKNKI